MKLSFCCYFPDGSFSSSYSFPDLDDGVLLLGRSSQREKAGSKGNYSFGKDQGKGKDITHVSMKYPVQALRIPPVMESRMSKLLYSRM